MKLEYTDIIRELSYTLFQALLEREPDLAQTVHELDSKFTLIVHFDNPFLHRVLAD